MKRNLLVLLCVGGLLSAGCAVAADDSLGPWSDGTQELEVTSPDPSNPSGEPGSAQENAGTESSEPGKPTPDPWNEVYVPDKPTPDPWEGSGSGGGTGSEGDEQEPESGGSSPSNAPASGGTR